MDPLREFRWQSLFQRSREPFFLLNRQRRLLFANAAWETLTTLSAASVRGRACTRRRLPATPSRWDEVARALAPPVPVLQGQPAGLRRRVAGVTWDVDFFPLQQDEGPLCVLGKITVVTAPSPAAAALPEKLTALRESVTQRYRLDALDSSIPACRRVAEQVRLAAQTRTAVLIVGEAGTGKQSTARTIHYESPERERPFAALDCTRLSPPTLAEVLFGDEGLITRGRAGTVYLKEPSRLPRDLQARLVEALEERAEGTPRLLVGSRSDLTAEVQSLRFLDELRCRLATLVVELPPLRQRHADLAALVEKVLQRCQAADGQPTAELTPQAWELVRAYSWPSNLRELYAVLKGARTHAGEARIDTADLPAFVRLAVNLGQTPEPPTESTLPLKQILEEVERRLIRQALRTTRGHKTRAAELLSIWRQLLVRRMEALGIADTETGRKESP
jgi:DNA-binding NtrC family response regulator